MSYTDRFLFNLEVVKNVIIYGWQKYVICGAAVYTGMIAGLLAVLQYFADVIVLIILVVAIISLFDNGRGGGHKRKHPTIEVKAKEVSNA